MEIDDERRKYLEARLHGHLAGLSIDYLEAMERELNRQAEVQQVHDGLWRAFVLRHTHEEGSAGE